MLFGIFFSSGKINNIHVIKLSSDPHLLYHSYTCVIEESLLTPVWLKLLKIKGKGISKAKEHMYEQGRLSIC